MTITDVPTTTPVPTEPRVAPGAASNQAPEPEGDASSRSGLLSWLPTNRVLDPAAFAARHRIVATTAWLQVPFLFLIGLINAELNGWTIASILAVQAGAAAATLLRNQQAKAIAASVTLFGASAVLIYLSGGMIEAHLHIFAMLPFVALYQDWRPLVASVVFVVVHHVGVSLIDPEGAFDHHAAQSKPLLWAFIHAAAVVVTVVGLLALWKVMEQSARETVQAMEAAERERRRGAEAAERYATALTGQATGLTGLSRRVGEVASVVQDTQRGSTERLHRLSQRSVEAGQANETTRRLVGRSSDAMSDLQERSDAIETLMGLLSEVAERTKLLALNATIEASRAGAAGRGFAVVASEVRDLADQSADAVNQVREMLGAIRGGTDTTVEALDEVHRAVDGVQAVQEQVVEVASDESAASEVLATQVAELTRLAGELATAADGLDQLSRERR